MEDACTTILFLELFDGWALLLNTLQPSIWNNRRSLNIVSLLWLGNVQSVHDGGLFARVLRFLSQSVVQQDVTCLGFDITDAVARSIRHLDQVGIGFLGKGLNLLLVFFLHFAELLQIDLGENDHQGLGLEERLDRVE